MTRGRMVRISEAWARLESQGERSLDLMESLEERGSAMDEGLVVELTRQRRLRWEILEDLARGRTRPLRRALPCAPKSTDRRFCVKTSKGVSPGLASASPLSRGSTFFFWNHTAVVSVDLHQTPFFKRGGARDARTVS